MNTDELITILSRAPRPKKPLAFTTVLAGIILACIAITTLTIGIRLDLADSHAWLTGLHKSTLLGFVTLSAALFIKSAAIPTPPMSRTKIYFIITAILFAVSISTEILTTPLSTITASFALPNFPSCLLFVSLYGSSGIFILTPLMRAYAPADTRKAAAAIGLAAATAGALGYSIHCPIDSPVFILIAYGIPVLLLSLVSRLFLPRLIRW